MQSSTLTSHLTPENPGGHWHLEERIYEPLNKLMTIKWYLQKASSFKHLTFGIIDTRITVAGVDDFSARLSIKSWCALAFKIPVWQ